MATDGGAFAFAALALIALAIWCFSHRRVDRTLAALGLYLGLFDAYLKLRTGSTSVTLARDVLVVAIAAGALLRTLSSHESLRIPPLGGFVLTFSAVVVIGLFNPDAGSLTSGLAGIRQHLEFVPLFFLGYAFIRDESQLQKLLFILVLCASAGGIASYIQSTLTPEQFADWGPGYRDRIFGDGVTSPRLSYDDNSVASVRPFGLGSDIGAGAVAAALALPALLTLLMVARGWMRGLMIPLGIGIALAIATSGTRAGLVTVFVSAVAFALIAATSRNVVRLIVGLSVGVVLVVGAFQYLGPDTTTARRAQSITPDRVFSTFSQERGSSIRTFGEYASRYPLGIGVGSVGPAATALKRGTLATQSLNTETEWNFLVLEVGLLGLGVFLLINFRLLQLSLTRIRRVPVTSLRLHLAAIAAPLVGLLAAGFAGPTTASVPAAPYFWFVAGVLSYWLVTRYRSGFATPDVSTGGGDDTGEALPAAPAPRRVPVTAMRPRVSAAAPPRGARPGPTATSPSRPASRASPRRPAPAGTTAAQRDPRSP
ncbi:MAG TPA: O-antigen ligase family protein [Solirubrobacteraceae bacterium]|nr:O-antigen ligase family protein [Solirubrobacteraceae bacterium]